MEQLKPGNEVIAQSLSIPRYGRAHLKAALAQDDERAFLQALHDIIDSLNHFDYDSSPIIPRFQAVEFDE